MLRHEDLKARLVAPTVFERLLPYVFNQINNFLMVLIKTVGQKTKSETPRPRSQKFENPRRKETRENEMSRLIKNSSEISNKIFRDSEFSGYHSPPLLWSAAVLSTNLPAAFPSWPFPSGTKNISQRVQS